VNEMAVLLLALVLLAELNSQVACGAAIH
jgi:hypothetical protein